jgi:hypothetical protein
MPPACGGVLGELRLLQLEGGKCESQQAALSVTSEATYI